MPSRRFLLAIFGFTFLYLHPLWVKSQPGATVTLDKPKKFENRTLASEKSGDSKMNAAKKFNQNLNTRYNFYFNANNKLNDIISSAKRSFREDYGSLLPFYNYELEYTAAQKQELDSIIYKCNNGILLHDLRNDWVDDLYLLMGKAYFLNKQFDSAFITFQYINYAFQPRSKDEIGYEKSIGSNINNSGNVYTISTKEKKNLVSKTMGHRPVRNDALIWMIRTFIENGNYGEAWSMVETLKRDVNFPKRLLSDLEEMQGYLYYKNRQFDSAAHHLIRALDNSGSSQERARREYLIAQLYESTGKKEDANTWFDNSIDHTVDPILEAYARINKIRLAYGDNEEELIRKNISELMSMAKKDKYEDYHHIIYYAAARMELQRNSPDAAIEDLKKSTQNNLADMPFRNKTFILLGDLAFQQKKYELAFNSYDSLELSDPGIENPESIEERKQLLGQIVEAYEIVRVEDSLLKIAALPEQERNAYVKNLSKKLRKEKGLKEEVELQPGSSPPGPFAANTVTDIFSANDERGDWYFHNTSLKARGFNQFRNDWAGRPNVDNWRRLSSINAQLTASGVKHDSHQSEQPLPEKIRKSNPTDISFEGLMSNVPLTPPAMKIANDSIENSLFALGEVFKDKLEDYHKAIENYELLLNRYPKTLYQEEVLFSLYYCYNKLGNPEKADFYKGYLARNFSHSKYHRYITNPKTATEEKNKFRTMATKKYEDIYNLFIEGKFDEALLEKRKADSVYGENFWSPQLLYIESMYYIKQRQDSVAIETLNKIVSLYPNSALTAKAANMANVVSRRQEIESYLTSLEIERAKEDSIIVYADEPLLPKEREKIVYEVKPKSGQLVNKQETITAKADSIKVKAPNLETRKAGFSFNPLDPQMVGLLLNKVDVVYANEARNALNRYNREKFYNQPIQMSIESIDDSNKLVLMSIFADAVAAADYMEKTRSIAASEIFPWLPAEKYSFIIISPENLEILKYSKDTDAYRKFLKESFSGKF